MWSLVCGMSLFNNKINIALEQSEIAVSRVK